MFQILDALDGCNGLLPVVKIIRKGVLPIIQIGIPILLIIMGSIDLGKAVLSSDEKAVKAAQGMLIKRVISAVAVFLVVTIVTVIMGLFSNSGVTDDIQGTNSWSDCWEAAGK